MLSISGIHRYALAAVLVVGLAAIYSQLGASGAMAAGDSLLGGKVASSTGQPLAGVPVRAHRVDSNVAVTVYTNRQGEYAFPGWSDLSPGSYRLGIDLPDFEPVTGDVAVPGAKPARVDFALRSRRPTIADATAADIVAALPGTDEQSPNMTHLTFHKVLVTAVQFAEGEGRSSSGTDDEESGEDTEAEPAPANAVLVTLALSSPQVEQVVFAAEFGHIWLTAEGADADESGTRAVTLGEAFGGVVPQ